MKDKNGKEIKVGDIVKLKLDPKYKGHQVCFNWHFINDEEFEVIHEGGLFKGKQKDRIMDYPWIFESWALEIEKVSQ